MKLMRTLLVVALLGAFALSAAGCSEKNVAARVNGEVITIEELDQQVEQLKEQYPDMFEDVDGEGRLLDYKVRLLDNLIDQMLVAQAAEEMGVEVSDSQVAEQIEQLKAGFGDEAQFTEAITAANMTMDSLEDQIREQLLTQQLIASLESDASITDEEIAAYYEKNEKQFYQEAAKRASHILFEADDEKTAKKVLAELEDGADFANLAKKYSTDNATAANGGDLGWPSTPYVEEFQAALDKLDVGEMSALVKSGYGWHIIKVTDEREASQQSLKEVSDQVKEALLSQRRTDAYQGFLDGLRDKAEIEIVLEELKTAQPSSETTTTK